MTVYQYQTGAEAQPEDQTQRPQGAVIQDDAGYTTSVVIRNGEAIAQHSNGTSRVTTSELNPHHGDGTVFATAQSMRGLGVREITPDTLITIQGVQGSVKAFEAAGLIRRAPGGGWQEGSGEPAQEAPQEAPEADNADALDMPSEFVASVDQAIDCVDDAYITPLVSLGAGVAAGQLDRQILERQMTQYSGVIPEEAAQRISTVAAAYQADFYAWAKESQPRALWEAVEQQMHGNSLAGYLTLAARSHRSHQGRWPRKSPKRKRFGGVPSGALDEHRDGRAVGNHLSTTG